MPENSKKTRHKTILLKNKNGLKLILKGQILSVFDKIHLTFYIKYVTIKRVIICKNII